ncbi:MAG TPA: translation initiation factor IF-1 [Candidatus Paceibacterota bacterium]|jgi:translation initiation factor IF-1|nr:translation initiation factor IF-1 [Candidatus Paceibacterota bacterium]HOH11353.1 translation initiation factor IF-1 [Candidatus Paceibacterota bacterium]HOY10919.1 translation initiation factor IF-1 [Candidatus Paceibacterota bacterium]HPB60347.1 translation initiation factor IF-1 [Candidatus Paceibacterota bacterium]HPI24631.1 translation initiation factor IF-1 [Candidatus Paceibacterota bacterium]
MEIDKKKTPDNSPKKEDIVYGVVIEALPNTLFKVKLDNEPDKEILAYLAGKMRINRIRVMVGDRVQMVMDPYGNRSRIVRRG